MTQKDRLELLELLDDLISDLSNDDVKLSKSLTRAKKVSIKLKDDELNKFITSELEGDFDTENFPSYRQFKANTKGIFQNQFSGIIQHQELHYYQLLKRADIDPEDFLDRPIFNSVPEMEEFYKITDTKTLMVEFSQGQLDFARKYLKADESNGWFLKSGYFEFSFSTFTQIMAIVRNRLIEMLLKIDDNLKRSEQLDNGKFYEDGKHFDAVIDLSEKISKAKKEIVLIDGYIDENTLKFFSKKHDSVKVKILTDKKSIDGRIELFVKAFNAQHRNLEVKSSSAFHDRFIVIDNKEYYHVGASIKDAGKKSFMITKIEEDFIIDSLKAKFQKEWGE
ncbi:MAG: hypothetical protein EP338_14290 [Bacteroidetes bacterium]|nr:MAG: hypothetical protein EP338_14290 [Bacteroidota bacterium]